MDEDGCLTALYLSPFNYIPSSGSVVITLDGRVIWSVRMDDWERTGEQGPGSGERIVYLDQPIAVIAGQVLAVDFPGVGEWEAAGLEVIVIATEP